MNHHSDLPASFVTLITYVSTVESLHLDSVRMYMHTDTLMHMYIHAHTHTHTTYTCAHMYGLHCTYQCTVIRFIFKFIFSFSADAELLHMFVSLSNNARQCELIRNFLFKEITCRCV